LQEISFLLVWRNNLDLNKFVELNDLPQRAPAG